MPKEQGPDLKKFLGKRVSIKLNGNRVVSGRLVGYDVFMNITLEQAVEEVSPTEKYDIGTMVRASTQSYFHTFLIPSVILQLVRGNNVIQLEALDKA